jgi:secondary thiamine-phosphate synthase enzyme
MHVITETLHVDTQGEGDTHDLTDAVQQAVERSRLSSGVVTVFVPGSTAGLTTIEFESGAVGDLATALEGVAPRHGEYAHNARWGDGNGYAHVRSALVGPSLGVPFADGQLLTGTWQQIVLVDFDNRPRERRVICQIMGT